ncbi:MAG: hypothetical protein R8G66_04750 [Cytophagales bacterium]|nr:hypothetical protein [Cytophagales bacterium]
MKNLQLRNKNSRVIHNRFDPVYIILDKAISDGMFRPKKNGMIIPIPQSDEEMLLDNILKHRWIAWVNIALAIFMYFLGLDYILYQSSFDVSIVVTGLLAPAMITGAAWFSVSFGGIPSNYINSALLITSCMFLSFSLSMTLLVVILCAIVHISISLLIIIPIYLALYVACILYDNTDGLKIGLDETQLKYSRAMLNFHRKRGLISELETQKLYFNSENVTDLSRETEKDDFVSAISNSVRSKAESLEEERKLFVANDLIADCLTELFKLVDIIEKYQLVYKEVMQFSLDASLERDQALVDKKSLELVESFSGALTEINGIPQIELQRIDKDVKKLSKLLTHTDVEQHLIDHQFAKIFKNVVVIIDHNKYQFMKNLRDEVLDQTTL